MLALFIHVKGSYTKGIKDDNSEVPENLRIKSVQAVIKI